jgi:hypothetical protein
MKTNHCGIPVDSDVPTTGVFNNNNLEFIGEDAFTGVDIDFEQHLSECKNEEHDTCFESGTRYLIGFVFDETSGQYTTDFDAKYSAIVNFDTNITQVLHSKWLIKGALCSPCYPGQVDADTEGGFLAYSVPPDVVGENENLIKRIFKKEE